MVNEPSVFEQLNSTVIAKMVFFCVEIGDFGFVTVVSEPVMRKYVAQILYLFVTGD